MLLWAPVLYTTLTRDAKSMPSNATDTADAPRDPSAVTAPAPQAQLAGDREPQQPANAKPAGPAPAKVGATADACVRPLRRLQRAFESEVRDARWANEQEARIPRLVAEAGFPDDAFDGQVRCRRTLCRFQLRVVENDMFALMKLAAKTQTEKGLALAYGAAEVVRDKTRVLVYVPREGASIEDLTAK